MKTLTSEMWIDHLARGHVRMSDACRACSLKYVLDDLRSAATWLSRAGPGTFQPHCLATAQRRMQSDFVAGVVEDELVRELEGAR